MREWVGSCVVNEWSMWRKTERRGGGAGPGRTCIERPAIRALLQRCFCRILRHRVLYFPVPRAQAWGAHALRHAHEHLWLLWSYSLGHAVQVQKRPYFKQKIFFTNFFRGFVPSTCSTTKAHLRSMPGDRESLPGLLRPANENLNFAQAFKMRIMEFN